MTTAVLKERKSHEDCCTAQAPTAMRAAYLQPVAMRLTLAQQPGGQISRLFDLLDLLKGVDLSKLPIVVSAIQQFQTIQVDISTEDGLKAYVRAGLDLAKAFAQITPTEKDDDLIAMLDHYLTEATALDTLASLVGTMLRAKGTEAAVVVSGRLPMKLLAEDVETAHLSAGDFIPWIERTISVAQMLLVLLGKLG